MAAPRPLALLGAPRMPMIEGIQHPARRQAFLYGESGSCLKVRSRHELMITRRLPRSPGLGQLAPVSPGHEGLAVEGN